MTPPKVAWITGRRKALARSLAIEFSRREGFDWMTLRRSERKRYTEEADKLLGDLVATEVLVSWLYPYRDGN